jgi:hypothetical protein
MLNPRLSGFDPMYGPAVRPVSGSTSASTDSDIKLGLPAYDDPGIT